MNGSLGNGAKYRLRSRSCLMDLGRLTWCNLVTIPQRLQSSVADVSCWTVGEWIWYHKSTNEIIREEIRLFSRLTTTDVCWQKHFHSLLFTILQSRCTPSSIAMVFGMTCGSWGRRGRRLLITLLITLITLITLFTRLLQSLLQNTICYCCQKHTIVNCSAKIQNGD